MICITLDKGDKVITNESYIVKVDYLNSEGAEIKTNTSTMNSKDKGDSEQVMSN